MKKTLAAVLAALLLMAAMAIYYRPIGEIRGAEKDRLYIDGVEYIAESAAGLRCGYGYSDRGIHLRIVRSGDSVFHVYTVRGDREKQFLYVRWEWEGEMYIRKDTI